MVSYLSIKYQFYAQVLRFNLLWISQQSKPHLVVIILHLLHLPLLLELRFGQLLMILWKSLQILKNLKLKCCHQTLQFLNCKLHNSQSLRIILYISLTISIRYKLKIPPSGIYDHPLFWNAFSSNYINKITS